MTEFLGNMYSWFTFIPKITLSNLFEILILTVLIYEVLLWVKSTRAGVLLRGGMIIVGFYLLAAMLHLNTITWIINHMGQLVLTGLIIIFHPESAGAARKQKHHHRSFYFREFQTPGGVYGKDRKRDHTRCLRDGKSKDRSADRDRA